ncbi:MAG: TonB-dependent receptor [Acetobacteraceae bacterium]|uniref:TonB-dependent receptor domain-containing protein n=1 Tax=Bradyrhizobium sp. TaxID=376 RepID=UPI003D0B42BE
MTISSGLLRHISVRLFSGPKTIHARGIRMMMAGCLTLASLALPWDAAFPETRVFELDIPPQSLSGALKSLYLQAELQTLYVDDLVRELHSPGISGRYTVEEALERLLQGSDLAFEFTGANTAVIKAAGRDADRISFTAITIAETAPEVDPDLPSNLVSVTRSELARRNVATAEDAVKYAPNLRVRKRFIGDRNTPIEVRGTSNIQSARGLVLADGMLLSNFLSSQHETAPRWSMIQPEEIERVDVMYGPYSALYSGNAMGAAIVYSTRMPDGPQADAHLLLHRQQFEYFGTDDAYDGHVVNGLLGDRRDRFSYQLGVSRLDSTSQPTQFVTLAPSTTAASGGETVVRGSYPVQNRNGDDVILVGVGGAGIEHTEQDEFKLKLGYDLAPDTEGRFTLVSWRMDRLSGRAGDTTYLRDADGTPVYSGPIDLDGRRYDLADTTFAPRAGEEEHWMYAASLKTRREQGWNYEASASLYDMKENVTGSPTTAPPAAFAGGAGTLNKWDGSGWRTFDAKAEARLERHRLTLGYHYDLYEMNQDNYATDDWRGDDAAGLIDSYTGRTETQALFAQDAWEFTGRWKSVLGLRVEKWRAYKGTRANASTAVDYPDRSESALSPKAAVEFAPADGWLFRLAVAKAHRFPTVTELFQGAISGNEIINSDPGLRPERGLFTDFTARKAAANGAVRFSLYREDTRDVLFRQNNTIVVPTVTSYQNIDRVMVHGVEIAYEGRDTFVTGLDLAADMSFNDSEIVENRRNPATEGNEFYRIPRARAGLAASYRQTGRLTYSLAGRYSGRQYTTLENIEVKSNALDSVSKYTVFDAKVSYRIGKTSSVGLGIDNIADKRYFVGHPYSGRTCFVELAWRADGSIAH